MWRMRILAGLGALAAGAALPGVPTASAANGPAYRDCSLALGLDPDFVQLLGATVSPLGTLTVLPSQRLVQLEGSESADPGDSAGADTLAATVSSRQGTQTVSGVATGKVRVSVPLAPGGKVYTISWAATFDNGNHQCPSAFTPENETPKPFVVTAE
ncbi:MAG TPA: hypothetical protein VNY35_08910 [Solirubrobacteraceae bacterium]|nr:hypothetical protein [Solirubrobacteraceae bacterium]